MVLDISAPSAGIALMLALEELGIAGVREAHSRHYDLICKSITTSQENPIVSIAYYSISEKDGPSLTTGRPGQPQPRGLSPSERGIRSSNVAIKKYIANRRAGCAWCRVNHGIYPAHEMWQIQSTKRMSFNAFHILFGFLGMFYLGLPLQLPLTKTSSLITTKLQFRPERGRQKNSVGIGGAYMWWYGMEGPGGINLFAENSQGCGIVYRRLRVLASRWLLRFFDQIRFYEVQR